MLSNLLGLPNRTLPKPLDWPYVISSLFTFLLASLPPLLLVALFSFLCFHSSSRSLLVSSSSILLASLFTSLFYLTSSRFRLLFTLLPLFLSPVSPLLFLLSSSRSSLLFTYLPLSLSLLSSLLSSSPPPPLCMTIRTWKWWRHTIFSQGFTL